MAAFFFFFSISISPNVKTSLPIFTFENKVFMFYNAPLLSVKSTLCVRFIASFLLIKLINTAIIRTFNV